VLRTVGPVWDGNEVWLLAAGGTLYCAFPGLYAASFSGLYLPLMIVLWLLILRGISIEFRNHAHTAAGQQLADLVFALASSLLAITLGAALGNVVRGAPLDASGYFFLPLWTDFQPGPAPGILDWYTVLVGLLAFVTLAQHGALWVALKTPEPLEGRARRVVSLAWRLVAGLTLVVGGVTLRVQPQLGANLTMHPWGHVFPALALAALIAVRRFAARADHRKAFLSSCAYIAGMLSSAAFGLFPYVLPSNTDPRLGLTVWNTATAGHGLRVALAWWIPGMILVLGYFVFVYRHFRGKVGAGGEAY
jgi:cytochrome d ubiquinol oxidase subunit II